MINEAKVCPLCGRSVATISAGRRFIEHRGTERGICSASEKLVANSAQQPSSRTLRLNNQLALPPKNGPDTVEVMVGRCPFCVV